MKEKLIKKRTCRRLLSVVLALMMAFSLMQDMSIIVEAESYSPSTSYYGMYDYENSTWRTVMGEAFSVGDVLEAGDSGFPFYLSDGGTEEIYLDNVQVTLNGDRECYINNDVTIDRMEGDKLYLKSIQPHEHAGMTFDKKITSAGGTLSDGNYYLDSDVTLGTNLTITGTVNLCLNGHVLKGTGTGTVITINSGATLNLYDCDTTTENKGTLSDAGCFWTWDAGAGTGDTVINGGVITGGYLYNGNGAGVYVNQGTFNMYGGTIAGNSVRKGVNGTGCGAGVYVNQGTFNMGGSSCVAYCKAHINGGGVYNSGYPGGSSFTMSDNAVIRNCMAETSGGGVFNYLASFIMTGGIIKDNKSTQPTNGGGGLCTYDGTSTIVGGEISGNTAVSRAGGVEFGTGTLVVGGTAKIYGNTKTNDNTNSNVYVMGSGTITIATAENAPAEGMLIGVTTVSTPTAGSPIKFATGADTNNYKYFVSDKSDKLVVYCDGTKDYDINGKELVGCHSSHTANTAWLSVHAHSWNYTVGTGDDANKITAKCEGAGDCTVTNGKTDGVSLTLTATSPNYSGSSIEPTITYGNSDERTAWTGAGIILPESGETGAPGVTKHYYKADASGNKTGSELGSTPSDVGKYVVEVNITYGDGGAGKKASVALPYEITKASQDAPAYDKFTVTSTADTVSVVPKSGDTTEYEYSINNGDWVDSGVFTGLTDATEYTIRVRIKENDNHQASAPETFYKYTAAKKPSSASDVVTVNNETEKITIVDGYEVSATDTFASTIANGATVTPNTTYYVRKKGMGEVYEPSEAVTFTTPERAATPATPVVESKTDTSIKIAVATGVEYSRDGGATWNTTGEFTGLTANTEYTITARVKAVAKFASEKITLKVTTKNSAPEAPEGLTAEEPSYIDNNDGKITGVDTTMEYSTNDGETWTAVTGTEITGLLAGDVKVRVKGTDTTMVGSIATVTVPASTVKAPSPAAPTGLTATKPSLIDGTDGKITGVTSSMEYSTDGGSTWTEVTGTEITGLLAGEVFVRVKGTDKVKVGSSATVTVPAGTEKAPAPEAPTGLTVVSPTTVGGNDGKITGVTSDMEYSVDNGSNWKDVEGTEITGLSAGNVIVRVKETDKVKVGTSVTLTVTDGTVKVDEDKQEGNFEAGGIKNTVEEVKDAVLTTEDKEAIEAGNDVLVWVEVKDHTETVTKEDKTKVEEKIEKELGKDFEVGTYLDVTLWKQITGSDANKVTNVPNGKVKIGFTIPKDLQKANRTYKIVRVHDGVAEIIDAVVDAEFGLTFETDRFSTYALIYVDAATETPAETPAKTPATGDTSPIALYVLMMGLAGVAMLVSKKRKAVR